MSAAGAKISAKESFPDPNMFTVSAPIQHVSSDIEKTNTTQSSGY